IYRISAATFFYTCLLYTSRCVYIWRERHL
ncbi:hypothetical protein A5884_003779, partial [Enterococcus sp. 7D2_DIV0200]